MNILKHLIAASLISLFFSLPLMAASMPGPGMMTNDNDRERYGQAWGGPAYGNPGFGNMGYGNMGYGNMGYGNMGYGHMQGYGGPMMGPGYGQMMGPGYGGMGYGGMMGGESMGSMMPFMHSMGWLDLNDTQRKAVFDAMQAMRKKHWDYMEQMASASDNLYSLYQQSPLDAKKIRTAYESIYKVKLNMIEDMVKFQNSFEASLNEEQRKSLREFERGGYPGQGMMR